MLEDPISRGDTTTLDNGTRVLSIRIHAGRKPFDEQQTVVAPNGDSRVFEISGATQTIRDGESGAVLARSTFTTSDLVPEPIVQPAFLPAVPLAIESALAALQSARPLELALSLLTVLSARKNGFGAMLGLTAHEYATGTGSQPNIAIWVGPIGQQALDNACPRNGEVLAMTNEITRSVRATGHYRNATDFGNKVHIEIAPRVNSLNDQDFEAEILLDPHGRKLEPRKSGNVRLDLLENVKASQTVCIYDYKTGHEEISMARAAQLVAAAVKRYPGLRRIIFIQVRPQS